MPEMRSNNKAKEDGIHAQRNAAVYLRTLQKDIYAGSKEARVSGRDTQTGNQDVLFGSKRQPSGKDVPYEQRECNQLDKKTGDGVDKSGN